MGTEHHEKCGDVNQNRAHDGEGNQDERVRNAGKKHQDQQEGTGDVGDAAGCGPGCHGQPNVRTTYADAKGTGQTAGQVCQSVGQNAAPQIAQIRTDPVAVIHFLTEDQSASDIQTGDNAGDQERNQERQAKPVVG